MASRQRETDWRNRYSLQGDLQSACEEAQAAGRQAVEAGWIKGEAIAAANLAFFYASMGNLEQGRTSLAAAERTGYSSPSFEYALRDTRSSVRVGSGGL